MIVAGETTDVARRPRGPKPRYTQAAILEEAVALLRGGGVDAFNLRALSDRLGVTPMALYSYFSDKDDLVDAVIAFALAPLVTHEIDRLPWDRALEALMREMYDLLTELPAVAELAVTREPGEKLGPLRERLFTIAARGGLRPTDSDNVLRSLTSYVFGSALVAPARTHKTVHPASRESFEFGLSALMTAARDAAASASA